MTNGGQGCETIKLGAELGEETGGHFMSGGQGEPY